MAMAFFKISNSCACRRARARSWRSSAAVSGSRAVPKAAAPGVWAAFLPLVNTFGVDVQGPGGGLG